MIQEIKKRLAAATQGPWKWIEKHNDDYSDNGGFIGADGTEICNFGNHENYYPTDGNEPNEADIELITHVTTDIAYLLAENEQLKEMLADTYGVGWEIEFERRTQLGY